MKTKTPKTKLSNGFKTKWVNALRSGTYSQCAGRMYDPETQSYDPLGVAHRVAGVSHLEIANKERPSQKYSFLPKELVEDDVLIDKIIDFNDKGMSFKWTAAYIERNL